MYKRALASLIVLEGFSNLKTKVVSNSLQTVLPLSKVGLSTLYMRTIEDKWSIDNITEWKPNQ